MTSNTQGEGIRYPDIQVKLLGTSGNVFAILGRMQAALKAAGIPPSEVTLFMEQATSGNYDHALQTCMQWVDVG